MNVSYRWLRDMVEGLELSPEEVAEHLALRGAPVESISSPAEGLRDVVVGKVLRSERHPNADRLSLCTVEAGGAEHQVVCGAPNVKAGAYYPFAPVGAVLPGKIKIKKAKIRGVRSEGMLCSERELGLGADHEGIMELEGVFEAGTPLVEALGLDDVTLDVEITANRGDLLSHLGIARELASEGSGRVRLPEIPGDPGVELTWKQGDPEVSEGDVTIRIEDTELCPRYLGAVIRGVKVGPSPRWLQDRLRGAGARSINNVVDATNYVMLELGQPLHAFDLRRLAEGTIVVRRARAAETSFTTLDGEERRLTPDMLMICDAREPVAIAGVMGGLDSEVDQNTTDVLLECALFKPSSIRSTRRTLNMSTDASYRFERGVDPEGMRRAVERAVALILAVAGGEVAGPVLAACHAEYEAPRVGLRLARVEQVLGVPFQAETVKDLLAPLGFQATETGGEKMEVRIPGFRSYDVTREIDLIEEIARTYGYDRFPVEFGAYRPGTVPDHPLFGLEDDIRRGLVRLGLMESQTPAFVPEGEGEVEVSNPLNTREPFVRRVLVPSLLRRVEYNFARGNRDVRLFEMGTSFRRTEAGAPPAEETHLALALTGRRTPPHWSEEERGLDVWDAKGIMEEAVRLAYRGRANLVPRATLTRGESAASSGEEEGGGGEVPPWLDPALAFAVVAEDGAVVGYGGGVRADAVDAPAWSDPVWGLELTLPAAVPPRAEPVYHPLPQYPAVERDLALLVPDRVPAEAVADVVRRRGGVLLESVEIFDLYRGEAVPPGVRSIAYRLRFRAPERTLKDREVDRAVSKILGRLKEELGVEQRG